MFQSFRSIARALLGRLVRNERGVSAVEFSVLAPFLVLGGVSTVDAGMAVYEKMMITQVLRAGAQGAIAAKTESNVLTILRETAKGNFDVAVGSVGPGQLGVSVTSYCVCPANTATAVACNASCSPGSPLRFYRLTATKEFDGIMLPDFTLSGAIDVLMQ